VAAGFKSQIHRKKSKGKPMPRRIFRANGAKSEVRARVEHVFARQKGPMALVVRTIGLARAKVKIGLANLVYTMRRMVWLAEPAPVWPSAGDRVRPPGSPLAHKWRGPIPP
jgi:transposase, IS5 family